MVIPVARSGAVRRNSKRRGRIKMTKPVCIVAPIYLLLFRYASPFLPRFYLFHPVYRFIGRYLVARSRLDANGLQDYYSLATEAITTFVTGKKL